MEKERWRSSWLNCINELTSFDLQRKSWSDKSNSNPHWSFVEFMSCYFDDLKIDNNYELQRKENWISKNEFELIQPWHELLDKYNSPTNDDFDNEAILNDKKWQLIVDEGLKAKFELSKISNEEERLILNEEIDYNKYK